MFSVKNGKCRVKGLVTGRGEDSPNKTVLSGLPGYYDLESVKRERIVFALIFAVADVT